MAPSNDEVDLCIKNPSARDFTLVCPASLKLSELKERLQSEYPDNPEPSTQTVGPWCLERRGIGAREGLAGAGRWSNALALPGASGHERPRCRGVRSALTPRRCTPAQSTPCSSFMAARCSRTAACGCRTCCPRWAPPGLGGAAVVCSHVLGPMAPAGPMPDGGWACTATRPRLPHTCTKHGTITHKAPLLLTPTAAEEGGAP